MNRAQTADLKRAYYSSPIGFVEIGATADAISSVNFTSLSQDSDSSALITSALEQIDEYFKGTLKEFQLPIAPLGTPFQTKVWKELLHIPYGATYSYLDIARAIGDMKAIRAVGTANGRNPISIIIPCHRVIGADGSLTGYGGGLWRKQWLLEHESAHEEFRLTP
jgi:methylated-DNA-[protein]-cysteine S-methyltransferase